VENEILIDAPVGTVWQGLTHYAGMGDWTMFRGRLLRHGTEHPNGADALREMRAPGLRILDSVGWSTACVDDAVGVSAGVVQLEDAGADRHLLAV
jgi:hypothetical protein